MPGTAPKDVFTLVPWKMLNQYHNAKEAKASKAVVTLTGILVDGNAISECLTGMLPYAEITLLSSPYMSGTTAKDVFTLVPWKMLNQHHNAKRSQCILADGNAKS